LVVGMHHGRSPVGYPAPVPRRLPALAPDHPAAVLKRRGAEAHYRSRLADNPGFKAHAETILFEHRGQAALLRAERDNAALLPLLVALVAQVLARLAMLAALRTPVRAGAPTLVSAENRGPPGRLVAAEPRCAHAPPAFRRACPQGWLAEGIAA